MNDEIPTNQSTNDDGGGIFGSPLIFSSNTVPQNQTSNQQAVDTTSNDVNSADEQKIVITNDFKDEEKVPEKKAPEEDLVSMGVTFVNNEVPPKQEVNIFSENSSFKHKEMEAVAPVLTPKTPEPVKPIAPEVPTEELENDFSKTFNAPEFSHNTSNQSDPIKQEEEKLKRLHKELKDKAAAKKIVVKERLEKLRTEKESLGKELEEIKEIEGIAVKIEEKLKALETIDTEIDSLENKAKEELQ